MAALLLRRRKPVPPAAKPGEPMRGLLGRALRRVVEAVEGERFDRIDLSFGHVERRIDDLETELAALLWGMAGAETAEERRAAIDAFATETMRAGLRHHRR